ncbi:MAG: MBL fold metallo-hydrolase, partial [Clostridia bacterium]
MSLKLVSLASGSRGNATLIISDTTAILVDAGISYTKIANGLKEFGLTPSML